MTKTDPNFIRRMKNHILNDFFSDHESFKVGAIIGTNGYVWIFSPAEGQVDKNAPAVIKTVSQPQRKCMSVLRAAILSLTKEQLPIFKETVELVI